MNNIYEVAKLAAQVVLLRKGDIQTENESLATTEIDALLKLDFALADTFNLTSDNVTFENIEDLIDKIDWFRSRNNEQNKALQSKIAALSIAVADNDIDEVKRLLPPNCEQVIREIQIDSVEKYNKAFTGICKEMGIPQIANAAETFAKAYIIELRNPEQDDSKKWVNHEPLRKEAITIKLEEQNRELLRLRDKELRERLEMQKRIEQEKV